MCKRWLPMTVYKNNNNHDKQNSNKAINKNNKNHDIHNGNITENILKIIVARTPLILISSFWLKAQQLETSSLELRVSS